MFDSDKEPKIKVVGINGNIILKNTIALREFEPEDVIAGFSKNFFRKKKLQYIETEDVCVYFDVPYKLSKKLEKAIRYLNKVRG